MLLKHNNSYIRVYTFYIDTKDTYPHIMSKKTKLYTKQQ